MLRLKKKSLLIFLVMVSVDVLAQEDIVGKWVTIDDDGETKKSVVELVLNEGVLSGRIVKILDQKKGEAPLCKKCKGEKKNQPILGMEILRDFLATGQGWGGGYILDPETGKEYKCLLQLIPETNQLKVRGYLGFALLGRTQYWQREDAGSEE